MKKTWLRGTLCAASFSAFCMTSSLSTLQAQDNEIQTVVDGNRIVIVNGETGSVENASKELAHYEIRVDKDEVESSEDVKIYLSKDGRIVWNSAEEGEPSRAPVEDLHRHLLLLNKKQADAGGVYQFRVLGDKDETESTEHELSTLLLHNLAGNAESPGDMAKHLEKVQAMIRLKAEDLELDESLGQLEITRSTEVGQDEIREFKTADGKRVVIVTRVETDEADEAKKQLVVGEYTFEIDNDGDEEKSDESAKNIKIEVEEIESDGDKQIIVIVKGDEKIVREIVPTRDSEKQHRVIVRAAENSEGKQTVEAEVTEDGVFLFRMEPNSDGARIKRAVNINKDVIIIDSEDDQEGQPQRIQLRVRPEVEMKWHQEDGSPSDRHAHEEGTSSYRILRSEDGDRIASVVVRSLPIEGTVLGSELEHQLVEGMRNIVIQGESLENLDIKELQEKIRIRSQSDEADTITFEVQSDESDDIESRLKSIEERLNGLEKRLRSMNRNRSRR